MRDLFTTHLPTLLVGLAVLAIFGICIYRLVRLRKKGQCTCGCSNCPYSGQCSSAKKQGGLHQP